MRGTDGKALARFNLSTPFRSPRGGWITVMVHPSPDLLVQAAKAYNPLTLDDNDWDGSHECLHAAAWWRLTSFRIVPLGCFQPAPLTIIGVM